MKRLVILLCLLPLLGACSAVMSEKPLFAAGERARWNARPGVWALVDPSKPDCKPTHTNFAKWPECAIPVIVRSDVVILPKDGPMKEVAKLRYLLVEGDPLILQLQAPEDVSSEEPGWAYLAIRPGPAGGAEARVVFPDCPKPDAPPIPGLEKKGGDCIAATAAAVRAAAARPEAETAPAMWIGKERQKGER